MSLIYTYRHYCLIETVVLRLILTVVIHIVCVIIFDFVHRHVFN
jgi:hypothetical protein